MRSGASTPVLPDVLVGHAGVRPKQVQRWTSILLAAYGGALAIGSPIFGYLGDRAKSRQIPFTFGLVALGLSTVFFMFAVSPWILLLARFLQGISGSAVYVVGLAMIVDNVEKDRIGHTMGYAGIAMTTGSLSGPPIGGLTYSRLGYYGVFIVPIALVVLDILLRSVMIENSVAHQYVKHTPIETVNNPAIHLPADETSALLPSHEFPGTIDTNCNGSGHAFASSGILYLIRSTRLSLILVAMVVIQLLIPAFQTTLPLFVQRTLHWQAGARGLMFMALTIPSFCGPLFGSLIDRVGTRGPGCVGFTTASVALMSMRFVEHNTTAEKALLVILLSVVSGSVTVVQLCTMTAVFHIVEETSQTQPEIFGGTNHIAQVYALLSVAAATSHFVGPLLADVAEEGAGWKAMTLVLGLFSAVTAVLVGVFGAGASSSSKRHRAVADEEH